MSAGTRARPDRRPGARRALFAVVAVVGVPVAAFALVEGMSSLTLLAHDLVRLDRPMPERVHTRYDPQLGWAGLPNRFVADMYGPGVYLRTNAQGFRNDRDFAPRAPRDRLRVVCSGDSFTHGWGVANDQAWCARLEARDARLEAVNMGQGGYGFGQAYLWYKRDGVPLEHGIHLFAFITQDFHRMQSDRFIGWGKPKLALRDGALVTENVPVPRRAFTTPRLAAFLAGKQRTFANLRTSQLLRRVRRRVSPEPVVSREAADSVTWEVARRVVADLAAINRAKNSVLVLVYLPTVRDWRNDAASAPWRDWVRAAAREEGVAFLDLIAEVHSVPADSQAGMYIPNDGHPTVRGHQWIADRVYQELAGNPEIARRLASLAPSPSEAAGGASRRLEATPLAAGVPSEGGSD